MTLFRKIAVLTALLVFSGTPASFAQHFPPPYSGQLDVCSRVEAGLKEGKSFESALVDLFLAYSEQPVQLYRSIQRSIIHAAIQDCHYDGSEVIGAALRIDMNLPLLVLSLIDVGVNERTLRDALQQAGLDSSRINEAFDVAGLEAQIPSPGFARAVPAPFEMFGEGGTSAAVSGVPANGGLGPASPFMP